MGEWSLTACIGSGLYSTSGFQVVGKSQTSHLLLLRCPWSSCLRFPFHSTGSGSSTHRQDNGAWPGARSGRAMTVDKGRLRVPRCLKQYFQIFHLLPVMSALPSVHVRAVDCPRWAKMAARPLSAGLRV